MYTIDTFAKALKKHYSLATLKKIRKAQGNIIKGLGEMAEIHKRKKEFIRVYYDLVCYEIDHFPMNPKKRMFKYWRKRYNDLRKIKKAMEDIWEIQNVL